MIFPIFPENMSVFRVNTPAFPMYSVLNAPKNPHVIPIKTNNRYFPYTEFKLKDN